MTIKRSFGERSEPRSYGDRPPRGDSRDNRDRGYRADARPGGDRPARSDAPRGNRFEQAACAPGPPEVPRMTGDRPPRSEGYRGAGAAPAPRAEVNGNSVEYWEKREREAKAKAATTRSYGDRGNAARPGQPRSYGNENRGGANRAGVRGCFKG